MPDKMVTVRMSAEEHQALRLHAVLQGVSVNSLVMGLIRDELGKHAAGAGGRSRQEVAAEVLARFGIDPTSPEHLAAVEKARQDVQYSGDGPGREAGAA